MNPIPALLFFLPVAKQHSVRNPLSEIAFPSSVSQRKLERTHGREISIHGHVSASRLGDWRVLFPLVDPLTLRYAIDRG